jgi:Tol biopolymer transport system component/tRNA A-37 threonylcarbamoyl transferase component Bud32
MSLQTGDTLLDGRYRILGRIGQGGFAVVYHARDTLLDFEVAIKEFVPPATDDPEREKRILAEAHAAFKLSHAHIVATHNFFEESDNFYLVMEYMSGGSLEDALQQRHHLPLGDVVRIAREVCEGLSFAHGHGIVHCDLKPANILFAADGTAKVADFGIAHVSSLGITTHPLYAGTWEYMSPEQLEGERSDPRIDLYALGAVLYHGLTGRTYADFGGSVPPQHLVRDHQPEPPSNHNSLVPPWLDDLVLQLLEKQPEDRPGTASEVCALLGPRPTQPLPPRRRSLPKWARYALLVALLFVALVAAMVIIDRCNVRPSPAPTTSVPEVATTVTAKPSPTDTSTPTPTPTATPTQTPSPTITPTPTPSPTPEGGRIAFASGADEGSLQICIMNVDDRSQTCLTDNDSLNESPAWSREGKRLAFHSRKDLNFEVYGMNADGSEQENLTNHWADDGSPSWSPDGRQIAFDSGRDGNGEIYVMDADGSRPTNLTNNSAWDSQPAWSPDGSQLAFMSDRDGNLEIYLMNVDGNNLTRLTDHLGDDRSPAWSPDGKLIAFFSDRDGQSEIYVMNTNGTRVQRLTNNDWNDRSPSWSPDGKHIAFGSDGDGNWEIYVMDADGSNQVNLTNSPDQHDRFPAWWGQQ